jgi:cytidine deaminase
MSDRTAAPAADTAAGGLDEVSWDRLRQAARDVRRNAYAGYSGFQVGAAGLADDGRLLVGCNVENAAYGVGLCAECGVVSSLHATGGGRLVAIACVGAPAEMPARVVLPCGRCRQLIAEQGIDQTLVDAPDGPVLISTLLPDAFGAEELAR